MLCSFNVWETISKVHLRWKYFCQWIRTLLLRLFCFFSVRFTLKCVHSIFNRFPNISVTSYFQQLKEVCPRALVLLFFLSSTFLPACFHNFSNLISSLYCLPTIFSLFATSSMELRFWILNCNMICLALCILLVSLNWLVSVLLCFLLLYFSNFTLWQQVILKWCAKHLKL